MQEGPDRGRRRHGQGREILRVKLGNKASKAASRVAAEGMVGVFIAPDAKLGAIIEVNCETDFVAKNDDFQAFTKALAELVAKQNPADVAVLSGLTLNGATVEATRTALVGKIGENMSIRRFARFEAKGKLTSYIHGGAKIGVLVDMTGDETLAKDVAMHIAASKPKALDASGCRPICSTPSAASPSRRRAKPASRRPCWRKSPRARCRSTSRK